jgi:hypothetical protein
MGMGSEADSDPFANSVSEQLLIWFVFVTVGLLPYYVLLCLLWTIVDEWRVGARQYRWQHLARSRHRWNISLHLQLDWPRADCDACCVHSNWRRQPALQLRARLWWSNHMVIWRGSCEEEVAVDYTRRPARRGRVMRSSAAGRPGGGVRPRAGGRRRGINVWRWRMMASAGLSVRQLVNSTRRAART